LADDDCLALRGRLLDGHHRTRAFGDDRTGRDRHGLARSKRPVERATGGGLADQAQAPRRVPGPNRVPVHRRAVERRQIDRGRRRFRQDSAGRQVHRHLLGIERSHSRQHECEGSLDRQLAGHVDHDNPATWPET
jgi:hypothetical protein